MHPFFAFHRHFHRDDEPADDRRERGRHGRHRHGRHEHDERGGPFGRGGGRGRSDLGRFFAHGDLRLLILQLIAEKPRHGYEIIKEIADRVAGAYSPSPGVVYPTLTMLDELGHIAAEPGEGTRKLYGITPEGQAMLDANRPALDAILARMAEASEAFGDGPSPSVVRATEGLKLALKLRLARGPLSEQQNAAIAAALDAAIVAIERS